MSKILPNIKDRILLYADYKEGNKQIFFRKTGLKYSNFTGKSKNSDLNSKSVAEIMTIYPDINPTWLITGKGSMLRDGEVISEPIEQNTNEIEQLEKEISQLKDLVNSQAKSLELQEKLVKLLEQNIAEKESKDFNRSKSHSA